jgi:hypothetical protein
VNVRENGNGGPRPGTVCFPAIKRLGLPQLGSCSAFCKVNSERSSCVCVCVRVCARVRVSCVSCRFCACRVCVNGTHVQRCPVKVIIRLGVHVVSLHLGEHPPAQLGSITHHLAFIRVCVSLRVRWCFVVRVVRQVLSS